MKICIDFGSGGGITPHDAKMLHYILLVILFIFVLIFLICDVIPWINGFMHSMICNVAPKWPVIGGCS
jgi:hypothetical protein